MVSDKSVQSASYELPLPQSETSPMDIPIRVVETNISIIYLFHIVLACIFFSHKQSLAVTLLACVMFSACITVELTEIIPCTTIFAEPLFNRSQVPSVGIFVLDFLSAMVIWLVVWYLTSHLSMMVRKRDTELAETNRRLVAAQEERSQHMRTTTHQLKSPFAAIHTNAELLLKGHCGPIPDEALEVVRRISARSRRLATEIQEMLQLADLSSARKIRRIGKRWIWPGYYGGALNRFNRWPWNGKWQLKPIWNRYPMSGRESI